MLYYSHSVYGNGSVNQVCVSADDERLAREIVRDYFLGMRDEIEMSDEELKGILDNLTLVKDQVLWIE